ncbi:MAG: type II toxin-antitoxin system Phd/YefM family antitoxin [Clostridiales bacterium]|nr:type II toxin-antitoxin system Phd/YefM family antitoxin [Clostridiales bacterium]
MMIDTKQIITVTEANQNFSKATRIADERGSAIVFKNNKPKYKLVNLEVEPDLELTDDEKIDIVARRIMQRYKPAFLELAK